MRTIATLLLVSLMLAVIPAHANDPQFMILDGAKQKTPEYVKFFGIFSETFIELLTKEDGQHLAPDHWIILLSPILSTTGETLVTIIAMHERDGKSELPILVAVLNERSDAAVIRTAAKSTRRIVVEAVKPQDQPPPPPMQKLKTNNPRTKQRAGVSIFMLS